MNVLLLGSEIYRENIMGTSPKADVIEPNLIMTASKNIPMTTSKKIRRGGGGGGGGGHLVNTANCS